VFVQPSNVEAQWTVTEFLDICVTGSLRPCASVIVKTQSTGSGTLVEMWVRNEQGSPIEGAEDPYLDNTGGSFLTQIGLTAPTVGTVTDFSVRLEGSVGMNVAGLDPNDYWGPRNGGLGGQVEFKASTPNNKNGAIRGCDQPVGDTREYFITCDDLGYTGAVVFSFTSDQEFLDDPQIALKFQSIADPNDANGDISLVCRSGEAGCSVTPEPSTWILLLTGMVGVFGMGWIRRRREEEDAA
jgi:hypothetical protein